VTTTPVGIAGFAGIVTATGNEHADSEEAVSTVETQYEYAVPATAVESVNERPDTTAAFNFTYTPAAPGDR
jgi:hypothetical protein